MDTICSDFVPIYFQHLAEPGLGHRCMQVSRSQYFQSEMGPGLSRIRKTVTFVGEMEKFASEGKGNSNMNDDSYVESSV